MSDNHITEQEQVEQLKKWLREYGASILIGIVVAIIGSFVWRYALQYREKLRTEASIIYFNLQEAMTANDAATVKAQSDVLLKQYQRTPYAAMASLMLAKSLIDNGQNAQAIEKLEWALKHSPNIALKSLIRIRLARVYMMQQQYPAATVLLDAVTGSSFLAEKSLLLGQIAEAKGDKATAKAQYAIVLQQKDSPLKNLAQLYLANVNDPDPRDRKS